MGASRRMSFQAPGPDAAVYVISVAAELSGLHPQTLRAYERMGLITPGRSPGGGRRYSAADVDRLRTIAQLTSAGVGVEGVRRLLDLENQILALRARNEELRAELEATREALRSAMQQRPATQPLNKLPVLPSSLPGQSVVIWRRPR